MIWTREERAEVDRADVALCYYMHWSYEELMAVPLRIYEALIAWVQQTSASQGE